jgi:hypothetical protein
MPRLSTFLRASYESFFRRDSMRALESREAEWLLSREGRSLKALERRGIHTRAELVAALPALRGAAFGHAAHLAGLLGIRAAVRHLRNALADPRRRDSAVTALAELGDRVSWHRWLAEARHEIETYSTRASRTNWSSTLTVLEHSFNAAFDSSETAEFLVNAFELADLPSWLRCEVADKVHFQSSVKDRRTQYHRRTVQAALSGMASDDPELRFGSIFVIAQLASSANERHKRRLGRLAAARVPLQRIASQDCRLSPGFW